MAHFGWTRLAYLLFALTVLIAVAQIGSPSADPRPLASAPPGGTAKEDSYEPAKVSPREDAPDAAAVDHRRRVTANAPGAAIPDAGPPVFYRPALAGSRAGSRPVCGRLGRFPANRKIVFPLPKKYLNSYEDTWGAPRPQGGHEGTDLMAPTGTPEYAATDGTIVPVAGANENGWNTLGGYAVMLEAAYAVGPVKKGDLFYYAHLDRESALEIGTRVRAGQVVGYTGDTGQGPEVTRGLFPPHLHLGWYDASGVRPTAASGAMNPYPLLEWIKANGGAIIGGSDARYCEDAPTPSTGESRWPAPESPGVSPDLDSGSNNPTPSPAARKNREHLRDPAKRDEPAPNGGSRDTPGKAAPKTDPSAAKPASPELQDPQTPRDEPPPGNDAPGEGPHQPPDGAGFRDRPDGPRPTPKADPQEEEKRDHPDEGHKAAKGKEEGKGEDKKVEPGEDPQPPDEQASPDEDQPPPVPQDGETGEESDLETTAPDPGSPEDPAAGPLPETTATPEATTAE